MRLLTNKPNDYFILILLNALVKNLKIDEHMTKLW